MTQRDHHGHSHAYNGPHTHGPSGEGAERRILAAMLLTGGFMVAEVIGGIVSGSLALIADAGHMATDLAALVLAYAGIRFGKRPADQKRSYGYKRLEVLAAFVNGITLLALTAWIVFEAAQRIAVPVEVLSGPMLVVAVLGLVVNLAAFAILRSGQTDNVQTRNVNVSGALVHVMGDLLGSLGAIAAALVIWFTGWMPIDPILSVFVALLIVRSGWITVRRSAHILLEGTPPEIDVEAVKADIRGIAGVQGCTHVHVWSLTSGEAVATLHLQLVPGASAAPVLRAVRERLERRFAIGHSTIEIDFEPEPGDGHPLGPSHSAG
jgi:cobalt-zinc-cadmium efflux system protein